MKIQFLKSLFDIPYDEWAGGEKNFAALPEHRGKAARVDDGKGGRTIMLILPCGHVAALYTWTITDLDTDTPSAQPSIFCRHSDDPNVKLGNCWHGYLTKGELIG